MKQELEKLRLKVSKLEDLLTADQRTRIRASLSIFETGSPEPNYGYVGSIAGDTGGLTYGYVRVTRASGNLSKLVNDYIAKPKSAYTQDFRPFVDALARRDPMLDSNSELRTLLGKAAGDPSMRSVQDAWFDTAYFAPAFRAAQTVGIRSALGIAVVLDSITHGAWSTIRDKTTKATGGTPASGVDERTWVRVYLKERYQWLVNHPIPVVRGSAYRPEALLQLLEQGNLELRPPLAIRGIRINR